MVDGAGRHLRGADNGAQGRLCVALLCKELARRAEDRIAGDFLILVSQAVVLKTILGTGYLWASGLFCLFTSWSSFVDPAGFGRRLGLVAGGADGLNEVRAQYGGFFLAVAAVDALVLFNILDRRAAMSSMQPCSEV
jgi:hypothetical protein